jgi:hypothetical protein
MTVIRGDLLDRDHLRAKASQNHDLYGFFGLSVYVVSRHLVAGILAHQLSTREHWNSSTVGQVYAAGLWLDATGRAPHYDAVRTNGKDLSELVERFLTIPFRPRSNPYYRRVEEVP